MVDLVKDKIDPVLSRDGAWVDIPDFGSVKLRRLGSPEYQTGAQGLRDNRMLELGLSPEEDLPEGEADSLMVEAMCRLIIADFGEDITSDGQPVQYTPDFGLTLFSDQAWRPELERIIFAARQRENFIKARQEANVKK